MLQQTGFVQIFYEKKLLIIKYVHTFNYKL